MHVFVKWKTVNLLKIKINLLPFSRGEKRALLEDSPGQSVYTQLQALARHNPAFVQSLQSIMTQNILAEDTESQAALSLILANSAGDQNGNVTTGGKAKSPLLPSPPSQGKEVQHSNSAGSGANNPQLMNMLFSAFQARISKQQQAVGGSTDPSVDSPTPPPPLVPSPPSQPSQQQQPPPPPPPTSQGLLPMPPPPPQPTAVQSHQYLDPATLHWQIHPAGLSATGVTALVGQPPPLQPPPNHQLHHSHQLIYPQYHLPYHQSLWASEPLLHLPPMGGPPPHHYPPPSLPLVTPGETVGRKRKVDELGDIDWKRPRLCTGQ